MDLLDEYSSDASNNSNDECNNNTESQSNHDESPLVASSSSHSSPTRMGATTTVLGQVRLIDYSSVSDDTNKEATTLFVRDVPHIRGNWAGHVFCNISASSSSSFLEQRAVQSVKAFCSRLRHVGWSGTVVSHTSNLHLSLSRPFFLQQSSFLEPFVTTLRNRLSLERCCCTRLVVTGKKLLVNDSRTRSFWCWTLSANPSIQRILYHVNHVLQEYQQDPYYESPEFHISLASLPGDVSDLLLDNWREEPRERRETVHNTTTTSTDSASTNLSDEDDADDENDDNNDDGPVIVSIDHVCITFGTTKHFRIDLKP